MGAMEASGECRDIPIEEVSLNSFDSWRSDIPSARVVHLKGFANELGMYYDEDVLKTLQEECSLLVWDGDDYSLSSFTRLVPKFLDFGPDRRAAAFRQISESSMASFKKSWSKVAEMFPGRLAVIPVEVPQDPLRLLGPAEIRDCQDLPPARKSFVLLGRAAIKVTGATRVLAMGGGGVSLKEAELSEDQDIRWTVFALSRGHKEMFPTLVDWAVKNGAEVIRGKDPNEDLGFGEVSVGFSDFEGAAVHRALTNQTM
ncbi:unnamed protein product [Cladocopium goreaui]|uniref:Alpha-1,3-mannosyl-glycoprotein 4-beta-N-acetylglucosaminyltransferase C n=1 Tax=Cladocopium goreaui TaxID=2562237 RepID=A0A9P1CBK3_9DINO|nr:unnamed protein product [Cladocopium goreaui]